MKPGAKGPEDGVVGWEEVLRLQEAGAQVVEVLPREESDGRLGGGSAARMESGSWRRVRRGERRALRHVQRCVYPGSPSSSVRRLRLKPTMTSPSTRMAGVE